jgi:hypothetical protein
MIGHFLAKKLLATTWWGAILLFIIENYSLNNKIIQPLLSFVSSGSSPLPQAVVAVVESSVSNSVSNTTIEAAAAAAEATATVASIAITSTQQFQTVSNIITNQLTNQIPTELRNQTIDQIGLGLGSGLLYISGSALIFIILGPAAAAATITGITTTKISALGLTYLITDPTPLYYIPKGLGIIAGLITHYNVNKYLSNNIVEDTNENNT